MSDSDKLTELERAIEPILHYYDLVATGKTQGSGGVYLANGRGTLASVILHVGLLESLARAAGRPVHPRDS